MVQWRRGRALMLTLALLVAVTVVGLAIAQDQETLKLRSSVAAADPRAPEHLAVLVGADVTRGNTNDVLTNGRGGRSTSPRRTSSPTSPRCGR